MDNRIMLNTTLIKLRTFNVIILPGRERNEQDKSYQSILQIQTDISMNSTQDNCGTAWNIIK